MVEAGLRPRALLAALLLVALVRPADGHDARPRRTLEVRLRSGGAEITLLALEEGEQARALRERADADGNGRLTRAERHRLCELAIILAYAQLSVASFGEPVTRGAPTMDAAPGGDIGPTTVIARAQWRSKLELRGHNLVIRSEGFVPTTVVVRSARGKVIAEGVAQRGQPLVLAVPK